MPVFGFRSAAWKRLVVAKLPATLISKKCRNAGTTKASDLIMLEKQAELSRSLAIVSARVKDALQGCTQTMNRYESAFKAIAAIEDMRASHPDHHNLELGYPFLRDEYSDLVRVNSSWEPFL
jgi:hypothetical protein